MKPVNLLKMFLSETDSTFRTCKLLSDAFTIRNCVKQGAVIRPLIFELFFRIRNCVDSSKIRGTKIKWGTSSVGLC
jgi:hypothetical protein